VTTVRIGAACFIICVVGTVVSGVLTWLALVSAGNSGYVAILVDPRYRLAAVIVTIDLVLQVVGFGAVAILLGSISRFAAWVAFGVLLAGNFLAVISNCSELWNSIAPKTASPTYDSTFFATMDLILLPMQMVGFGIFGVLLVANRAIAFGTICLLAIPEIMFALYCMHGVDFSLQQTLFWIEIVYNTAVCCAGLLWLRSRRNVTPGAEGV
jgi:hypothetical protein